MTNIAFTSIAATTSIANKVLRAAERASGAPMKAICEIVHPMAHKLEDRGKLTRQELRPIFDALADLLGRVENIIHLDFGRETTGKLSSNDSYRIRLVHAEATDDWMELMACDVLLTRHRALVTVNTSEFNVTSHALARYMQRHRKPHTHFFNTVIRPLRLSTLLSPVVQAANGDDTSIILPIDGGILVGSLCEAPVYDEGEEPLFPFAVAYDKTGAYDEEPNFPPQQVATWMKTYIDRESLNRRQQGVLDSIELWEATHRKGIEAVSQAVLFGNTRLLAGDSLEQLKADAFGAAEGCRLLIDSPEWRYLET